MPSQVIREGNTIQSYNDTSEIQVLLCMVVLLAPEVFGPISACYAMAAVGCETIRRCEDLLVITIVCRVWSSSHV